MTKRENVPLEDLHVTRRYFNKFERITGHLARVAGTMEAEGRLSKQDVEVLTRYVMGLTFTFRALSNKYLFSGRMPRAGQLMFDRVESGFPIFTELMEMANDAAQAERHLAGLGSVASIKDEMVRKIVGDLEIPTKLQFALSQRLYYEELMRGEMFWASNHPVCVWQGNKAEKRRSFLIHWAVYDSQLNLPTVYLMEVEDTGRVGLPKNERRWPEVQAHLMAQASGSLKLLTIAKGFDEDFDDLHPKRLRRFHIGPMYSHAFTQQAGPLREVLEDARAPVGDDWALVWTEEELLSDRVEKEKSGWFGTVEREVFALDPFSGRGAETGATSTERCIILPQRPYQSLEEKRPPGFKDVRKFVVSPQGRVLSYR
jgi:hypothetical protein